MALRLTVVLLLLLLLATVLCCAVPAPPSPAPPPPSLIPLVLSPGYSASSLEVTFGAAPPKGCPANSGPIKLWPADEKWTLNHTECMAAITVVPFDAASGTYPSLPDTHIQPLDFGGFKGITFDTSILTKLYVALKRFSWRRKGEREREERERAKRDEKRGRLPRTSCFSLHTALYFFAFPPLLPPAARNP
jgi:hypothetical protein